MTTRQAIQAAMDAPVLWQYRWTNPGKNPHVSESELKWEQVVPENLRMLEETLANLKAYRYSGLPCYEVRPLYARPAEFDAELAAAAERERVLREALEMLHDDIAEYQQINNLGGYDNHCMKLARAALKGSQS